MSEQTVILDYNLIPTNISKDISKLTLISEYFDQKLSFIPENVKDLVLLINNTSKEYVFEIPSSVSSVKIVSKNIKNTIKISSTLLNLKLHCEHKYLDLYDSKLESLSIINFKNNKTSSLPSSLVSLLCNDNNTIKLPKKLKNLKIYDYTFLNNLPRLDILTIEKLYNNTLNNLPYSLTKIEMLNTNLDYINIDLSYLNLISLNVFDDVKYNNDNLKELYFSEKYSDDVKIMDIVKYKLLEKLSINTEFNDILDLNNLKHLEISNTNFNSSFNLPNLEYLIINCEDFNKPLNNLSHKLKKLLLCSSEFNYPLDLLPESLQLLAVDIKKYNYTFCDLPTSIKELFISSYTKVNNLPSSINKLVCSNIEDLCIPNNCEHLLVSDFDNIEFNNIPQSIKTIVISMNSSILDIIINNINFINNNNDINIIFNESEEYDDYDDDYDDDDYTFFTNYIQYIYNIDDFNEQNDARYFNYDDYNEYNELDGCYLSEIKKNINKIKKLKDTMNTQKNIKIHIYNSKTRKLITHDELFKNYSF